MADAGALECWFEFGSNYSYLSVMRIEALAQAAGVTILWRPLLLGPVFKELGWATSPCVLQAEKGAYAFRDTARRAARLGLAFRRPSVFPRVALLPMRVAVLGAASPWMGASCRRVMLQNWVEDLDINRDEHVLRALDGLVPDPQASLAAALAPANKTRLRALTEDARRRGIFGAPTSFVGDDMFWGTTGWKMRWAGP